MDVRELAVLVRRMREAQKDLAAFDSRRAQKDVQRLAAAVDAAVEEVLIAEALARAPAVPSHDHEEG